MGVTSIQEGRLISSTVGSETGEKQEVTQVGSRCKGEHVLLFQIKYQAEKFYVSAPFVEYFA